MTRDAAPPPTLDTGGSMPALGAILTAIVTPFDDRLGIDEEAFVNLMAHLADHGSDGFVVCGTTGEAPTLDRRGAPAPDRARRRRAAGGQDDRRGHRVQRHPARVHLTERATELGADAMLSVTPVLQPAEPARHHAPLRGGRRGDRQADHPLQHPPADGHRHAQRPARRARPDRASRVRQAGQQRQPRARRRARHLRRQRRHPRPRRSTSAACGGILVASHIVGDADAADGRRAGPAGGDRRGAPGRVRDPVDHHQPDLHQGRPEHAGPRRSAACGCPWSRPTEPSATPSARCSAVTASTLYSYR